ncbi:unnamed protein product [Paramecium sonneborni]|uniref:Uncharacterized protein n=1 Tax=Paramecium sonneborni TaxID=65129 RepID=A0A8S1R8S5_9CILI|nr:unnamed protein product [Paramecium sonneborni]
MQINRNEEALEFFEYAINRNPDDDINYAFKGKLKIKNKKQSSCTNDNESK